MAYSMTGDIMAADPQCWYKPKLEVENDIKSIPATESSRI